MTGNNVDVINNNNFSDIKTDKNGGIWTAQYGSTNGNTSAFLGGLNYFPDSTDTGMVYYSALTSGLPSRSCRAIYIDTSSVQSNPRIWTAHFSQITGGETAAGGVGLGVFNNPLPFQKLTGGLEPSNTTLSVQTIAGDENQIWAFVSGNYNKSQILEYNSQTGAFIKAYDNNSIGEGSLSNTFTARAIYFDTKAKQDTIDRRWVGLNVPGILVYEKPLGVTLGSWSFINHVTKFPTGSFVNNNSITGDDQGNVFFGTKLGLVVYTGGDVGDSTNFLRFTTSDGLPSNDVLDIVDAPHLDKIIIATAQGIVFWNKSKFKRNISGEWKLVNLTENFNQGHYTVPREATVHHYFIVKNNQTDEPKKGITVVFKYLNDFQVIFSRQKAMKMV